MDVFVVVVLVVVAGGAGGRGRLSQAKRWMNG